MDAGALPAELPATRYAGYGSGVLCAVCDEPITAVQVEYEMDYGSGQIYWLHLACADLWEAECRARGYR